MLPHEQRHQHATQATVAVQEGVKRLELGMQNGKLHQPVRDVLMDVAFPNALMASGSLSASMGTNLASSKVHPGWSDPVGHTRR